MITNEKLRVNYFILKRYILILTLQNKESFLYKYSMILYFAKRLFVLLIDRLRKIYDYHHHAKDTINIVCSAFNYI